jgi:hypothetical protein
MTTFLSVAIQQNRSEVCKQGKAAKGDTADPQRDTSADIDDQKDLGSLDFAFVRRLIARRALGWLGLRALSS